MAYKIISDGACDLNDAQIKEYNVDVIPYYVSFDSQNYYKERVELKVEDFYQKMIDNPDVFPKTSTMTVSDCYQVFEKYAKDGLDILYIHLSAKFSASYTNAILVANEIREKYHVRVEIVDGEMATLLQALLIMETAKMQMNGLDLDETIRRVNIIKKTGRIYFTVKDMSYLVHGGRVGKVKGLIGATLKIKPMIELRDAEIYPLGIVFTQKQAIVKVTNYLINHFKESGEKIEDYSFIVGYGAKEDYEDIVTLKTRINKFYPDVDIPIGSIGATIGVHTGPHPLGVGIIKKFDMVNEDEKK